MTSMRHSAPAAALFIIALATAVPAGAQYGVRRTSGADRALLASAEPAPVAPTIAALVIRYGGDLQLSDRQLTRIQSIRLAQDSANRPWTNKLDSLRNGPRPVNPNDLSQEQRDNIAARAAAVSAASAAMRETNAGARKAVMDALDPGQRKKADTLEKEARRATRDEAERRGQDAYGRGDRRGGMGRPREG